MYNFRRHEQAGYPPCERRTVKSCSDAAADAAKSAVQARESGKAAIMDWLDVLQTAHPEVSSSPAAGLRRVVVEFPH
jgi:hypothetical protein